MLEAWVREHLACPDCQRPLDATSCVCGFAASGNRFIAATPFRAPRRLLEWSARDKTVDELHRTGSICFVAEKR